MSNMRKITISAREDLIAFVDQRAVQEQTNRSRVISQIIETFRNAELERIAAEGYRYYAEEAEDFAAASAEAVSDAIGEDSLLERRDDDSAAW